MSAYGNGRGHDEGIRSSDLRGVTTRLAEFSQPDITMNSDGMNIVGRHGVLSMVWSGESPDNVYEYAADSLFRGWRQDRQPQGFVGKINTEVNPLGRNRRN